MSKQSGLAVGAEIPNKPHSANCIGKDKYYTMFTTMDNGTQQTVNTKTNMNVVYATLLSLILSFCTRQEFSVK